LHKIKAAVLFCPLNTAPIFVSIDDVDNDYHYPDAIIYTIGGENIMSKKTVRLSAIACTLALSLTLLSACGSNDNNNGSIAEPTTNSGTNEPAPTSANEAEASGTRVFKDWTGHDVEVPVNPQRVIYHGEVTGDLLALGVQPVGLDKKSAAGTVYEQAIASSDDVGFPFNVEKAMTLDADLIIFSNSDDAQYEQISKVAPTVTFDSFAKLEDRMNTLGDLLNKQQEAADWIAQYKSKSDAMWKKLKDENVIGDETAVVLTMYPGNRLFVMANAGLPQFLYESGGFRTPEGVQALMDQEQGFAQISNELLPEYAADRIFILNPVDVEAQNSTNDLQQSEIWRKLPAVQAGHVYFFDIVKANSDASSREWLIDELPKALAGQQ
jgi:iron complex transport system substrate-binding protein